MFYRRFPWLIPFFGLFLLTSVLLGQSGNRSERQLLVSAYPIDLSLAPGTYQKEIAPTDTLQLMVSNRLLNEKYRYQINVYVREQIIEAISLPGDVQFSSNAYLNKVSGYNPSLPAPCDKIKGLHSLLLGAAKEEDLPKLRGQIIDTLKTLYSNSVNASCETEVRELNALMTKAQSFLSIGVSKLRAGQTLHVDITRFGGEKVVDWNFVYRTPSRGQWQTTFGLSLRPYLISEQESYFLTPVDSLFRIDEAKPNDWFDLLPTIFFNWVPAEKSGTGLRTGISGGFGLNVSQPSVYLGVGFSYHQNLHLSIGLTAHEQRVLAGQYATDRLLKEIVNTEDLYDNAYRLNPFLNLSFRFSSNPFTPKPAEPAPSPEK
ncbi:hypothetical protein QWY85_17200 [Neolewinella lacunae]|uniref:Uncharacterized protein n=1 Tax=Neolewinella lacunae TaxID=1517758 RepID=A0A923PSC9_9BACT|nr:hypothetical protein [Neolewinella lacunae]MBC6995902.1 hypothetical protein [Neolewinella lacunae]MDN3636406.1 hypothetical protein [Neolewinella lacunae]